MVNENIIPKTETVYELKDKYEIPSFEEFMKNWKEGKGVDKSYELEYQDRVLHGSQYSPGSEKKIKGKKKIKSNEADEYNEQHLIHTLNNKWGERGELWDVDESADKNEDGWHAFNLTTSAGASSGVGGVIADGGYNGSVLRYSDHIGDIRIGSGSLGGEAGIGLGGATLGYSANLDAVNLHTNSGVRANIGLDGGSNFTAGPGGVEVKAAGFGVSVGKKMGFSTPLGGASIDFEETCNQQ